MSQLTDKHYLIWRNGPETVALEQGEGESITDMMNRFLKDHGEALVKDVIITPEKMVYDEATVNMSEKKDDGIASLAEVKEKIEEKKDWSKIKSSHREKFSKKMSKKSFSNKAVAYEVHAGEYNEDTDEWEEEAYVTSLKEAKEIASELGKKYGSAEICPTWMDDDIEVVSEYASYASDSEGNVRKIVYPKFSKYMTGYNVYESESEEGYSSGDEKIFNSLEEAIEYAKSELKRIPQGSKKGRMNIFKVPDDYQEYTEVAGDIVAGVLNDLSVEIYDAEHPFYRIGKESGEFSKSKKFSYNKHLLPLFEDLCSSDGEFNNYVNSYYHNSDAPYSNGVLEFLKERFNNYLNSLNEPTITNDVVLLRLIYKYVEGDEYESRHLSKSSIKKFSKKQYFSVDLQEPKYLGWLLNNVVAKDGTIPEELVLEWYDYDNGPDLSGCLWTKEELDYFFNNLYDKVVYAANENNKLYLVALHTLYQTGNFPMAREVAGTTADICVVIDSATMSKIKDIESMGDPIPSDWKNEYQLISESDGSAEDIDPCVVVVSSLDNLNEIDEGVAHLQAYYDEQDQNWSKKNFGLASDAESRISEIESQLPELLSRVRKVLELIIKARLGRNTWVYTDAWNDNEKYEPTSDNIDSIIDWLKHELLEIGNLSKVRILISHSPAAYNAFKEEFPSNFELVTSSDTSGTLITSNNLLNDNIYNRILKVLE